MPERALGVNRRRFLQASSALFASAGLSACQRRMYSVLAAGTMAPKIGTPITSDLTIDTHCHLFNGTDVQLKTFLRETQTSIPRRLVDLAQDLEEKIGPKGEEEFNELKLLAKWMKCATAGEPAVCSGPQPAPLAPVASQPESARAHIKRLREAAYHNAKSGLSDAMRKRPPKPEDEQTDQDVRTLLNAPDHPGFEANVEKSAASPSAAKPAAGKVCGDGKSLGGKLEEIVDYFLPRIVLAQLYLDTFCPPAGRNVDLMFAAMVDYDWWLAEGNSTFTPLKDQVKVMEQISILSGGRIHGFVPFCPLREVAALAGQSSKDHKRAESSLAFVQEAILNHGCVGVKLYPPMGFAPYGNARFDQHDPMPGTQCDPTKVFPCPRPDFWSRNTLLPEWARQKTIRYESDGSEERLGVRLDAALDSLYKWCQEEQVPILAHTNTTNGVNDDYKDLARAEHWRVALAAYPGLRVSFGHMGGFDDEFDGKSLKPQPLLPDTSRAFIELMGDGSMPPNDPQATYLNAYADSAYDAVLLSCQRQFVERLDTAYETAYKPKHGAFDERFLFGTDWSLMVQVGHNRRYLKDYEKVMERLDAAYGPSPSGRKPSEEFFGWNAVKYAGLEQNGRARKRLEAFYAKYCLQKPGWARKVDQGGPMTAPA